MIEMFEIIWPLIYHILEDKDLCIGNYNYLVLDNVFDNKFLQYFMKTHYNFTMETESNSEPKSEPDKCPFELKILDDNVESISIFQNVVFGIKL